MVLEEKGIFCKYQKLKQISQTEKKYIHGFSIRILRHLLHSGKEFGEI